MSSSLQYADSSQRATFTPHQPMRSTLPLSSRLRVTLTKWRWRWLIATLATALPLSIALLFYTFGSPSTLWNTVSVDDRIHIDAALRPPPKQDRERGLWRLRIPPLTTQDLSDKWNGEYALVERLPEEVHTTSEDEWEAASRARAVALANWEWIPEVNSTLAVDWDWETWTTRLLQSTSGLIIIGDSIHLQLFKNLQSKLPSNFRFVDEDGYYPVYGFNDPESEQPAFLRVHLPEDEDTASKLLKKAGVPASRLSRPLLTFIRDDTLVPSTELAQIRDNVVKKINDDGEALTQQEDVTDEWKKFTTQFDFTWDSAKEGQNAITNVVISGWEQRLQSLLAPLPDWAGAQKTVIVVNTGAHWGGPCLPGIGEPRMRQVYSDMVDRVAPKLAELSKHAAVIYRPTVPGHPNCDPINVPYTSLAEAVEQADKLEFEEDMGWNLFPEYNRIWRAAFSKLRADIGWLPVYDRTLMRPDSHRLGGDCLHMEGASLLNEWGSEVWRTLDEMEYHG